MRVAGDEICKFNVVYVYFEGCMIVIPSASKSLVANIEDLAICFGLQMHTAGNF